MGADGDAVFQDIRTGRGRFGGDGQCPKCALKGKLQGDGFLKVYFFS